MEIQWKNWNPFKPKNKTEMIKNEKLSAILGRVVAVGEALSAEDSTILENALANPTPVADAAPETQTPPVVENVDQSALIQQAVATAIAPLTTQMATFNERLNVVEGSAGTDPTTTPKVAGADAAALDPWNDPSNPLNKAIDAELGDQSSVNL